MKFKSTEIYFQNNNNDDMEIKLFMLDSTKDQ